MAFFCLSDQVNKQKEEQALQSELLVTQRQKIQDLDTCFVLVQINPCLTLSTHLSPEEELQSHKNQ